MADTELWGAILKALGQGGLAGLQAKGQQQKSKAEQEQQAFLNAISTDRLGIEQSRLQESRVSREAKAEADFDKLQREAEAKMVQDQIEKEAASGVLTADQVRAGIQNGTIPFNSPVVKATFPSAFPKDTKEKEDKLSRGTAITQATKMRGGQTAGIKEQLANPFFGGFGEKTPAQVATISQQKADLRGQLKDLSSGASVSALADTLQGLIQQAGTSAEQPAQELTSKNVGEIFSSIKPNPQEKEFIVRFVNKMSPAEQKSFLAGEFDAAMKEKGSLWTNVDITKMKKALKTGL